MPPLDEWEQGLFVASYGGLELDVVDTSDDLDRAVTVHSYPGRDGGEAEDLGAEPRSTRCTLVFFPSLREGGHLDRLVTFLNLANDGEAHPFVHPLTGRYRARPTGLRMSAQADQRDMVVVSVTFVEDDPEPAIFETADALAAPPVDAALAELDGAAVELVRSLPPDATDVGAEATVAARAWATTPTLSPRTVSLELSRLANRIAAEAARLDVATDIDRQPALQNFRRLRATLRRVAERVIANGPRLTDHTVTVAMPLLVVVQQLYGADDVERRAEQLLSLNTVRDPTRIPAGTRLRVPTP